MEAGTCNLYPSKEPQDTQENQKAPAFSFCWCNQPPQELNRLSKSQQSSSVNTSHVWETKQPTNTHQMIINNVHGHWTLHLLLARAFMNVGEIRDRVSSAKKQLESL